MNDSRSQPPLDESPEASVPKVLSPDANGHSESSPRINADTDSTQIETKGQAERGPSTSTAGRPLPSTAADDSSVSPRVAGDDRSPYGYPQPRRVRLPIILFVLTCLSTFWVGASQWSPDFFFEVWQLLTAGSLLEMRVKLLAHWDTGLIYMAAVMLILILHEMGHFVGTIIYRVPASFPFFLPFPANPLGTLGAVIAMQGNAADRKEIFDIGIAGPLAGLVAAVPIAYFGVSQLDLTTVPYSGFGFRLPLLMDWFAQLSGVPGYESGDVVWLNQLNPLFVAGWVGMLITGVNMMPIGQLDGGHITYCLFGKAAHTIAQLTIVFAIAYMVYYNNFMLILMVVLLLLIGPNHPPTRDDTKALGPFRYGLGLASLAIPFLCFPPQVFKIIF